MKQAKHTAIIASPRELTGEELCSALRSASSDPNVGHICVQDMTPGEFGAFIRRTLRPPPKRLSRQYDPATQSLYDPDPRDADGWPLDPGGPRFFLWHGIPVVFGPVTEKEPGNG